MRHDYSTEQFREFRGELRESFGGQVRWRTQHALLRLLEADSEQQMAEYFGLSAARGSEEGEDGVDSPHGFYERDYVTAILGAIRVRVRRTRKCSFLPCGLKMPERRAPEVAELFRQAFLRGISTRAVRRVMALLANEPVSAQTVSRLTRVLDEQVEKLAQRDEQHIYPVVLLLVTYGVRGDRSRQLLAFTRARGESQVAWDAFLWKLHERGLAASQLQMVISDGSAGLPAAIETIYPRARHQRCGVWPAWRESSMRFFRDSISCGKTAPSLFLRKQLDLTLPAKHLCRLWHAAMSEASSLRRIALARDPVQHFLLSKPEVRLDANIWDEPTLHIAIDRLHVDPEKGLEFPGSEDFGELGGVRLLRRACRFLVLTHGILH